MYMRNQLNHEDHDIEDGQLYDSDLIALIAVYIGKVRLIDNIIIESTP